MYGYTTNPLNRAFSSGGSSGGEGALLALRGSPLGVGTDLGGSIRRFRMFLSKKRGVKLTSLKGIPASFCGLYCLKPSSGRFPVYGIQDSLPGLETVRNVVGPMAPSLSAIRLWSETVISAEPWRAADPDCLPMPWRQVKLPKKLCIGNDGPPPLPYTNE